MLMYLPAFSRHRHLDYPAACEHHDWSLSDYLSDIFDLTAMASAMSKGKEPARPLARIDVDYPPEESLLPVESNREDVVSTLEQSKSSATRRRSG